MSIQTRLRLHAVRRCRWTGALIECTTPHSSRLGSRGPSGSRGWLQCSALCHAGPSSRKEERSTPQHPAQDLVPNDRSHEQSRLRDASPRSRARCPRPWCSGGTPSRKPKAERASSVPSDCIRAQQLRTKGRPGTRTNVSRPSSDSRANSIGRRGPSGCQGPRTGRSRGSQTSEPQPKQAILNHPPLGPSEPP